LQVYNDKKKEFEKVKSTVSCKDDISDKGDVQENCVLIGEAKVPAFGYAYAKVVPNSALKEEAPRDLEEGITLSQDAQSLTYLGYDDKASLLNFQYKDTELGIDETVQFSVRYWQSYIYGEDPVPFSSGAYCFRPIRG